MATYRKRQSPRRKQTIPVVVRHETGQRIVATHILNLSTGGAKIKLDLFVELPDQFLIILSEGGDVQRLCRLIWRTAGEAGVCFVQPASSPGEDAAAGGAS